MANLALKRKILIIIHWQTQVWLQLGTLREHLRMKLAVYLMEQVPYLVKMVEEPSQLKVTFCIVWKVGRTWALPRQLLRAQQMNLGQDIGPEQIILKQVMLIQFLPRNLLLLALEKVRKYLQGDISLHIVELINPTWYLKICKTIMATLQALTLPKRERYHFLSCKTSSTQPAKMAAFLRKWRFPSNPKKTLWSTT